MRNDKMMALPCPQWGRANAMRVMSFLIIVEREVVFTS
jgi:hypothetical protein